MGFDSLIAAIDFARECSVTDESAPAWKGWEVIGETGVMASSDTEHSTCPTCATVHPHGSPCPVCRDFGMLSKMFLEGEPKNPDPGEGWRLLAEGEPLQEGDGFFSPEYQRWMDYKCRPAIFTGGGKEGTWYYCPKNDTAHTWPWRRKISPLD